VSSKPSTHSSVSPFAPPRWVPPPAEGPLNLGDASSSWAFGMVDRIPQRIDTVNAHI
jgi:hypothetical protein